MYRQKMKKINIKYNQPQKWENIVTERNPRSSSEGCQNITPKSEPWSKDNETQYRACLQETSRKNKRQQLPVCLNILSMGVLFVPSFVVQARTERHGEAAQAASSKQQPSPLLTACTILPAENQTPNPISHKTVLDQCTHWNVKLCWHSRWSTILYMDIPQR